MMSAMMAAGQLELLQVRLAICCQGASQGCRLLLRDLLGQRTLRPWESSTRPRFLRLH